MGLVSRPPVWYSYDRTVKISAGTPVQSGQTQAILPIAQVPEDEMWRIERYFINPGNVNVSGMTLALTLGVPPAVIDLNQTVDYVNVGGPITVVCAQPILIPSTSNVHGWFFIPSSNTVVGWTPSIRMQYEILKRAN